MDPEGFHEATVNFAHQVDVGISKIDAGWNPLYVQIEGEWVHLVRKVDAKRGDVTVFTVPRSAINSITWTRFFNSGTG